MDHVCRKVRLRPARPSSTSAAAGAACCSTRWQNYGALGTGINTTTEQVAELRAEIARARADGQDQRRRVRLPRDSRPVRQAAVDRHARARRSRPARRGGARPRRRAEAGRRSASSISSAMSGSFDTEYYIRKYIFPGGWIPSLAEAIDAMERMRLEVLDVENLRRHYALTLDAWAERFDANWEAIHALDPRPLRRALPPHLAHVPVVVRRDVPRRATSRTHLFQVMVSKGNVGTNYPMSRVVPVSARCVTPYVDEDRATRRPTSPSAGASGRPRRRLGEGDVEPVPRPRAGRAPRIDLSHFDRCIARRHGRRPGGSGRHDDVRRPRRRDARARRDARRRPAAQVDHAGRRGRRRRASRRRRSARGSSTTRSWRWTC